MLRKLYEMHDMDDEGRGALSAQARILLEILRAQQMNPQQYLT